jgi:hypothetical protein
MEPPNWKPRRDWQIKTTIWDQQDKYQTMRLLLSSLSTILRRHLTTEAILAKLLRSWRKWIGTDHGSLLWIWVVQQMQPFRQSKISNLNWNSRPIMMINEREFLHWRRTRWKRMHCFGNDAQREWKISLSHELISILWKMIRLSF